MWSNYKSQSQNLHNIIFLYKWLLVKLEAGFYELKALANKTQNPLESPFFAEIKPRILNNQVCQTSSTALPLSTILHIH